MTEEQREAQELLEKWRLSINDLADADGINKAIPEAKAAGKAVSALLNDRALKLGLTFDPKAKAYVAPAKVA